MLKVSSMCLSCPILRSKFLFYLTSRVRFESSLDYPFREAFNLNIPFRDPKTYLTCPKEYEALKKLHEDESQGADIFLVTPGSPHIHITKLLRDNSPFPIAAYQVLESYQLLRDYVRRLERPLSLCEWGATLHGPVN